MAEKTEQHDEFRGVGGAYVIRNGKRVREQDATQPAPADRPLPNPPPQAGEGDKHNVVELSTRKPK